MIHRLIIDLKFNCRYLLRPEKKRRNCWSCWWSPLLLLCVYQRQRHPDMQKYILTFVRGSGSVWVHLSTILRVQVHWSKILLVQVRFGFTKMKRFIRVCGSGSGSVRHPGFKVCWARRLRNGSWFTKIFCSFALFSEREWHLRAR